MQSNFNKLTMNIFTQGEKVFRKCHFLYGTVFHFLLQLLGRGKQTEQKQHEYYKFEKKILTHIKLIHRYYTWITNRS